MRTFITNSFLLLTFFCVLPTLSTSSFIVKSVPQTTADYIVIGAGPAGIGAVAMLDHLGIARNRIAWIDTDFTGGDLTAYPEVPANAKNKSFFAFFNACKIFKECPSPAMQALFKLGAEEENDLINIIQPLIEATAYMRTVIPSYQSCATALDYANDVWHVTLKNEQRITATHIILATGSSPVSLDYEGGTEIPLATALTPSLLRSQIQDGDIVTVVGGAHSAVLALKNLVELQKDGKLAVGKVINLFNTPIAYVEETDGGFLHPHSGIKGTASRWAHKYLDSIKNWPCNLVRMKNTQENRDFFLKESDKIVYAIGYKPNHLPTVNSDPNAQHEFNQGTGEISGGAIGPRIFGIGLAYPGMEYDAAGNKENRIGLQSFMEYAQSMIPEWISRLILDDESLSDLAKTYRSRRQELEKFGEIFNIEVL